MIVERDQGERISSHLTIVSARDELVMTESLYPPGKAGPDPHIHRQHVDCFYVLGGELAFRVGPDLELVTAGPGVFVMVPPEVVHTFENEAAGPARFLNLHAPGCGFERYLRDGAEWDSIDTPGGGRPAAEVVVRPPGEGVKAGPGDGIGSLSLVELTLPGGSVPQAGAAYLIERGAYVEGEPLPDGEPARLLAIDPISSG